VENPELGTSGTSARPPSRPRRAGRLASTGAIREAAATLFLEKGYQGTSMDEIAAAAQVSKQTIYTHFANKEELFAGLVLGNADRVDAFVSSMASTLEDASDLESGLRRLARMYIHFVIRPEVLRLRRLVLGEAGRFPELARAYYERVPARVYAALARLLQQLADDGRLRLDDPMLAAHHFAWLTLGMSLDHAMFSEAEFTSRAENLDHIADAAVRVFLAAYAAP
jgi:TetR/AcrR family transcriptional regulator, mexJK operon transcriptional repressor